jgi:hypothetical protein
VVDDPAILYYWGVSYDDGWPWNLITDPAIRDEVYTRYLPCNGA